MHTKSNQHYTTINRFPNLNTEQQQAVDNIFSAQNFPLPYILYGPPGTGKTHTLVTAVEKIVNTTKCNVLVCANSNAVCDEIAGRLLGILDSKQIIRHYAQGYDIKKIKPELESISIMHKRNQKPKKDLFKLPFLYGFRVVICTLCAAHQHLSASQMENFDPAHFSYVIIDECASTHETMTLAAIAGMYETENFHSNNMNNFFSLKVCVLLWVRFIVVLCWPAIQSNWAPSPNPA